jgi:hypothetical protein
MFCCRGPHILFVRPHYSVDLLLVVDSTLSSSSAANEKDVEEPKEKEMEGEKTEKEKSTKDRFEQGRKFVVELPPSSQYVWLRAVMILEKVDEDTTKFSLDIEGKHDMTFTPWTLIKKTKNQKAWIHDNEKIEQRNKKEALEVAAKENKKHDDVPLEGKDAENQIAAADLEKMKQN